MTWYPDRACLGKPYTERMALATHWMEHGIQPSSYANLGYVKNGIFYSVFISMHKQKAKKNFKKYDTYEEQKK